MPCYVFTPPLFWVASAALLATTLLFSSAMPTSALTFKKESGYWVPHQWRHSRVDCPCMAAWRALLVTSRLCWCQCAVSAGWPCRSFKFFSVITPPLPNMHWGWISPLSVPLHSLPSELVHKKHTHTHHTAQTKGVLLHFRDKSKSAPWSPHTCALNAQQMYRSTTTKWKRKKKKNSLQSTHDLELNRNACCKQLHIN